MPLPKGAKRDKTIKLGNGRKPVAWLLELVSGLDSPVVQVFEKESEELVYALRFKGNRYQPGVFGEGEYVVKVGETDEGRWKTHTFKAAVTKHIPSVKLLQD